MSSSKLVVFIMGPTASGKTDLAMELSEKMPCALISVDSALVYKGMDIGTAKPRPDELARAPHALIDICDPAETYSASRFVTDATHLIEQAHKDGKLPVLVGGTMLYFNALKNGLADLPEADPQIRERLEQEAQKVGWPEMHKRLAVCDPATAKRLEPADSQRIQRALEVYELTGVPLSEHFKRQAQTSLPYETLSISIAPSDKALLNERIEQRFDIMLEKGLIEEVETLKQRSDLGEHLPSMRSVGYRQVWQYLSGELSFDEMRDRAIIATRQLAKRQRTWLRKWPELIKLTSGDPDNLHKLVAKIREIQG